MLHIELVPSHIKHYAVEIEKVTAVIKADLQSGAVKTAETYAATLIPAIDPIYNDVVLLCQKVIDTCEIIKAKDWHGVEARLAMLVTEITHLKDGGQHGIGKYFMWCQIVLDWILGKDKGAAITDVPVDPVSAN